MVVHATVDGHSDSSRSGAGASDRRPGRGFSRRHQRLARQSQSTSRRSVRASDCIPAIELIWLS